MLVHSLEDRYIESIGHAFGYYDYGEEKGLASAFQDRDRTAVYITGFARAISWIRGMLFASAVSR